MIIIRDIIGYEGYYKITEDGRVFSVRSNRFLSLNYKKNGYVYIELNVGGIAVTHRIHRLVAEAYIDNPENKQYVHHINNIKSDNRVENLEWATASENTLQAYADGKQVPILKDYCIRFNNEIIKTVRTHAALCIETGYSSSSVTTYLKSGELLRRGKYKDCKIELSQV